MELFVRLTPKSSRDVLEGVEVTGDGRAHLKARVRAVPEKGKANAALERLIADALGVPASNVSLVAGGTARLKIVRVEGDAATIETKLSRFSGR